MEHSCYKLKYPKLKASKFSGMFKQHENISQQIRLQCHPILCTWNKGYSADFKSKNAKSPASVSINGVLGRRIHSTKSLFSMSPSSRFGK